MKQFRAVSFLLAIFIALLVVFADAITNVCSDCITFGRFANPNQDWRQFEMGITEDCRNIFNLVAMSGGVDYVVTADGYTLFGSRSDEDHVRRCFDKIRLPYELYSSQADITSIKKCWVETGGSPQYTVEMVTGASPFCPHGPLQSCTAGSICFPNTPCTANSSGSFRCGALIPKKDEHKIIKIRAEENQTTEVIDLIHDIADQPVHQSLLFPECWLDYTNFGQVFTTHFTSSRYSYTYIGVLREPERCASRLIELLPYFLEKYKSNNPTRYANFNPKVEITVVPFPTECFPDGEGDVYGNGRCFIDADPCEDPQNAQNDECKSTIDPCKNDPDSEACRNTPDPCEVDPSSHECNEARDEDSNSAFIVSNLAIYVLFFYFVW